MRGARDPKALTQEPSHHQRCQPFCFELEIFNEVVAYLGEQSRGVEIDDDRDMIAAQLLNNTENCHSVKSTL